MASTKATYVFAINPDTFNTTTEFCNIIDLETGLPALPQDFEFGVENPTLEYTKEIEEVVKVDGKKWTAISNKKIKVDSTVKVLEIDGVKLKVEEVSE